MLASSQFTRTMQTKAHAQENGNRSILLCLYLCLRHACKPEQHKHKHKRKHKALMLASHQFTGRFLVLMLVVCVNQALSTLLINIFISNTILFGLRCFR